MPSVAALGQARSRSVGPTLTIGWTAMKLRAVLSVVDSSLDNISNFDGVTLGSRTWRWAFFTVCQMIDYLKIVS